MIPDRPTGPATPRAALERLRQWRADMAQADKQSSCSLCGGKSRHGAGCPLPAIDALAAPAADGLDVERFLDLFVRSHLSNHDGMRAGVELSAWAEDLYEARGKPWPLPRIDRSVLREPNRVTVVMPEGSTFTPGPGLTPLDEPSREPGEEG